VIRGPWIAPIFHLSGLAFLAGYHAHFATSDSPVWMLFLGVLLLSSVPMLKIRSLEDRVAMLEQGAARQLECDKSSNRRHQRSRR